MPAGRSRAERPVCTFLAQNSLSQQPILDTISFRMRFLSQPFATRRLGNCILENLADTRWTSFRAAIAFVKRSGTQHIRQALQQFDARASVRISVGISFQGSSKEGLQDLLTAAPHGEVWVYHNPGNVTFHPKTYLFRNDNQAELLVGSGNLTSGGLFKNYEASLALSLDLNSQADLDLLNSVESVLNGWSQANPQLCHRLTPALLQQLVGQGYVKTEAQMAASAIHQQPPGAGAQGGAGGPQGQGAPAPLFVATPVPPAPVVTVEEEPADEEPAAAPAPAATPAPAPAPVSVAPVAPAVGVTSFVMTLQNTDVGTGQTTPGTSARSPEVFIPLVALDLDSAFWNFPNSFTPDTAWNAANPTYRRNGLGKLDRNNVPMRIGVVHQVNMFFNPRKKDFRIRHEAIRSAGNIGDILWVQKVNPANGFEYDIQVAPQGTLLFLRLQQYCTTHVVNSQKQFGYF